MSRDTKEWLEVVLILVLADAVFLGGLYLIVAPNTRLERSAAEAAVQCADLGYQEAVLKHDVYYCVMYGLEPEALRLATVDELDAEYREAYR